MAGGRDNNDCADEEEEEEEDDRMLNLNRVAEGEDEAEDVPAQLWLLLPADLIRPILKERKKKIYFIRRIRRGIDQINLERENQCYGK